MTTPCADSWLPGPTAMLDHLRTILLRRRRANKDHQAWLSLLVASSTSSPNRNAEALMPDSASRHCGPRPMQAAYAPASSRGVNVSRALDVTTTLIAPPRLRRNQPDPPLAVANVRRSRSLETAPKVQTSSANVAESFSAHITRRAETPQLARLPSSNYLRGVQGAFDLAGQFLDVDRPRNNPHLLLVEGHFSLSFSQNETSHGIERSLVAGCTTGSLCPRCPSLSGRAHSLYLALGLSQM